MGLATLAKELGLEKAWEGLQKTSAQEPPVSLGASAASLVKGIRAGTVTVEEIDSFLRKAPQITLDQKEYLLSKKAWLLLRRGDGAAALLQYEEALTFNPQSAKTWTSKGAALLELDRPDEAFQAFQQAYLLREKIGPQKQGYLKDLLQGWSTAASLRGVFGILQQDARELQKGVEEYLGVLDKARAENLRDAATVYLKAKEPASDELHEVIEEWELAVRLLSIKDPFDRMRALVKEVSKVWPKGVSAVDAVREQHDRERASV
jgi:tetratricopeptide (TPR) repeat protein